MNIRGIVPAVEEDGLFVLDKTGSFSLDTSVRADIFLVGGGCDGSDGYYDETKKTVHGGVGGDGGHIYKFGKITLLKNTEYAVRIADTNEKDGTYIIIGQKKYSCADMGRYAFKGGAGSVINSQKATVNPQNGLAGIFTPVGYVGSSGGGGCAVFEDLSAPFGKGGYGAGSGRGYCPPNISEEVRGNIRNVTDAKNYGCGGGGNPYFFGCKKEDVGLKSKGMGGCVIILCTPYDENFPDLTVRYWNIADNNPLMNKNAGEMTEILQTKYFDALKQNDELKDKLKQLENNNDDI